jgi:hypothetical protein
MGNHEAPKLSSLSQTVTRAGKSVNVKIYQDRNGRWVLEVIDAWNNSSVWNDFFSTDQAALNEVLATIEDEGIDGLIMPPDTAR